jgi:hypothetical protein
MSIKFFINSDFRVLIWHDCSEPKSSIGSSLAGPPGIKMAKKAIDQGMEASEMGSTY